MQTILTTLLTLSSSTVIAGDIEDTATTAAVKPALIAEEDIPANDIEVTTKGWIYDLKLHLVDIKLTSGDVDDKNFAWCDKVFTRFMVHKDRLLSQSSMY